MDQGVDYVAMSFVGHPREIVQLRKMIANLGRKTPIIAKIERRIALAKLPEIIHVSDAIMVARGDLGNEIPLEKIPMTEKMIIGLCKQAHKPVITATQMLLSMTEHPVPTRAEVTDVFFAIANGSDAVMLSEESANGKYPVEAVSMMERITAEASKHYQREIDRL
jgi:pyruvate kinase